LLSRRDLLLTGRVALEHGRQLRWRRFGRDARPPGFDDDEDDAG
jgi:hypothetical protein